MSGRQRLLLSSFSLWSNFMVRVFSHAILFSWIQLLHYLFCYDFFDHVSILFLNMIRLFISLLGLLQIFLCKISLQSSFIHMVFHWLHNWCIIILLNSCFLLQIASSKIPLLSMFSPNWLNLCLLFLLLMMILKNFNLLCQKRKRRKKRLRKLTNLL